MARRELIAMDISRVRSLLTLLPISESATKLYFRMRNNIPEKRHVFGSLKSAVQAVLGFVVGNDV